MQVQGWQTSVRNESNIGWIQSNGAQSTSHNPLVERSECEHPCLDLKDRELCLSRLNQGKTLVEARTYSNVHIDCQTWIWGRNN